MSLNPVSCGNCGTVNPPDRDVCVECGSPLTGSADEALRESAEAQDRGGLIGGGGVGGAGGPGMTPGTGLPAAGGGLPPRG